MFVIYFNYLQNCIDDWIYKKEVALGTQKSTHLSEFILFNNYYLLYRSIIIDVKIE